MTNFQRIYYLLWAMLILGLAALLFAWGDDVLEVLGSNREAAHLFSAALGALVGVVGSLLRFSAAQRQRFSVLAILGGGLCLFALVTLLFSRLGAPHFS